jgi:hypothetical protein
MRTSGFELDENDLHSAELLMAMPFEEALQIEACKKGFQSFCQKSFTEESLDFYFEAEKYRSAAPTKRKELALQITDLYVRYSGERVVNMQSSTRKKIVDLEEKGVCPTNLFFEAQGEVLNQLEQDSWPKFLEAMMSNHESEGSSLDILSGGDENDFGEKTNENSFELKEVKEEILSMRVKWGAETPALKGLLAKKDTRELLKKFAGTILAKENVMFWETVQRFKLSDSMKEREKLVELLFEEFIPPNSVTMVNIAGSERARLMAMYKQEGAYLALEKDVFDPALVECIKVMELDLYPKFLSLVKESGKQKMKAESKPSSLSLEEILSDENELNNFLQFVGKEKWKENHLLFWCLVDKFRMELNPGVKNRLGEHVIRMYVSENGAKEIAIDPRKRSECLNLFLKSASSALTKNLFDPIWNDVFETIRTELYPSYISSGQKQKFRFSTTKKKGMGSQVLQKEIKEAMKGL